MPEVEGGSPTPPEVQKAQQPEAQKTFEPSWIIEKEDEFAGMSPRAQLRARQLHQSPESIVTGGFLRNHFRGIQGEVRRGEIPEDEADVLLAKIAAKIEELDSQPGAHKKVRVRTESPTERVLGDLTVQLGDLIKVLQQEGELRQAAVVPGQPLTAAQSQTAELRDIFGRLDPEKEKARWVDVEYSQEFYTRFTPNMEPHFYTMLEKTSERAEWDARWKLARAAFWKKVYSAFPEKLAENQDLIELTKEQMEILYTLPGVKEALKWYAETIVNSAPLRNKDGKEVHGDGKEVQPGERPMTILDCKSGDDFEKFREAMRGSLGEKKIWDEGRWVREGSKEDERPERRELSELEKKSADAIAWNWIWCGNLIESIDSRYAVRNKEIVEDRSGITGRHGGLAPALCSDDLRAVFHPQEKFEDKCSQGLEWGVFGKWGQTQVDRIKERVRFKKGGDEVLVFVGANSPNDYWKEKRTNETKIIEGKEKRIIRIYSPECYPVVSLRSFFEEYDLVDQILKGEIDWDQMKADLWKTSYVTVKMRKAISLFENFTSPDGKPGWSRKLLDSYRRLGLDDLLGKRRFHNLKVWAVWANFGGVGRPQESTFTLPFSRSAVSYENMKEKYVEETLLKRPQTAYLEPKENLDLL